MSKVEKPTEHPKVKKNKYANVPIPLQILAGLCAGFFVTPFNTIVDKSIIENANGRMPLWKGVGQGLKRMFSTPKVFMTSYEFKWIFFVYSSTYATSNVCDHINIKGVDPALVKLTITFLVNTTASLIKDKALAQAFGATQVKPFPNSAFGLFLLRDMVAMASAFTIPPILSQMIQNSFNIQEKNALKIAQISSPLLIQFIGTPLHLLGLDYYNREGLSFVQRMTHLRSIYWNSLLLRMLRFLPAYGIGGIFNIQLRNYFKGYGDEKK